MFRASQGFTRCLFLSRLQESLKVCYDHTVRDNDGSVVQFQVSDYQTSLIRA